MTQLGDVCTKIGSGATPKGGRDAYRGGDYVLIRSQNILDWSFSDNGLARINADQASKLDSVAVMPGDVLLNITGDSVARACMAPAHIQNARINQHVCIIRPKPAELDSTYALMELQNRKATLLQIASSGATRNALTKHAIETLDIDLPSLTEQKKLSAPIDNINRQIACLNRTNGYLAA